MFCKTLLAAVLVVVVACGGVCAQQAGSVDIRQHLPADAVLVATFDGRADNPSVKAVFAAQDERTRQVWAQQQAEVKKAVEDFATLFGVSLDFSKDLGSWTDSQWALALLPEEKRGPVPVFMLASKDQAAASAALDKLLAPWQRMGELVQQQDGGYSITSFKAEGSPWVFAATSGSMVAFSPSVGALKQVLAATGFPAGTIGDKVFNSLSGSLLSIFASPAIAQAFGDGETAIPLEGLGIGLSAMETGLKMRVLGFPSEEMAATLKQLMGQQTGALATNSGVPSPSLIAVSLPSVGGAAAMAGMFLPKNVQAIVKELADVQISTALTAALPLPSGVVSVEAPSEQAAADKMAKVTEAMKQAKLKTLPPVTIAGVQAIPVVVDRWQGYVAQVGKYLLLGSDGQSFGAAVAAAKREGPALSQTPTYKETMAGLADSNLLTLYGNLAPIQGVGYLVNGIGLGRLEPLYGAVANALENVHAYGLGVGFDGTAVGATLFLRAKPGATASIGPVVLGGAAMGAAIMYPVFERAREAARKAECTGKIEHLAIAARSYANDHKGLLPSTVNWKSDLKPYVGYEDVWECPAGDAEYAFNKNLGRVNFNKIQNRSDVVIFFEAKKDLPNAAGSRTDAVFPHNGLGEFAYADGRVDSATQAPDQSHWVPKMTAPKPAPVKKAPVRKPIRRK